MKRKLFALLTAACLLVGMLPTSALAEESPPACANHPTHEGCGYSKGTPEIPCDKGCTETDESGAILHGSGCAYAPNLTGTPCSHSCELCAPKDSGSVSNALGQKPGGDSVAPQPLSAPNSSPITGTGYSFNPDSGELTITSDEGTSNWRYVGSGIDKTAVTSVAVQSGVKKLNDSAFQECANLVQAVLPDSLEKIGQSAFWGCGKLELTALPDTVDEIGPYAFLNCARITLTELPANITKIEQYAFVGCTELALTELPDNVNEIGPYAFQNCAKITLTELPTGVTKIKEDAFSGCTALALTKLPENVDEIGRGAFWNCANITLTELPSGVTKIKEDAFSGCGKLTLSKLPDTVDEIGPNAFQNCAGITLTKLPDTVTEIGSLAFFGCTSITSLTLSQTTAPTLLLNPNVSNKSRAFDGIPGLVIYVPKEATGYNTGGWLEYADKIVSGAALSGLTISSGTFNPAFHPAVTTYSVYVSNAVGSVTVTPTAHTGETIAVNGNTVASGQPSQEIPLTAGADTTITITATASPTDSRTYTITITDKLIGPGYSFNLTTGKLTVTTNEGATNWGNDKFISPADVTSVEIKSGVTEIAANAFTICSNLGQVDLPDSLKKIGQAAFWWCPKLTMTKLPEGVTEIGWGAFGGCTELALTELPPGLTKIEGLTFTDCTNLVLTKLPSGVTEIGQSAFSGCTNLALTELPSGLTAIGDSAFWGCAGITHLTLHQTTAPVLELETGTNKSKAFDKIPGLVIHVPYGARGYDQGGWLEYADKIVYGSAPSHGGGSDDDDDTPTPTEQAVSKVKNAKDGDTVELDLPSNGKLPGKVLEEAAGKDITLEIDAGNGVTWVINGKDIPKGKLSDLNLKVDTKANTIPVTVINTITGEKKVMQLALSHNGPFGFSLTLRLETGKENAGLFANLYYYNEAVRALEYQSTAIISADGSADLPFEHASSYAVVIDKDSHAPVNPSTGGGNPFTDVSESDWFFDAVMYVYHGGIMQGTSGTTFSPNGPVTRAMPPVVLYRAEGSPAQTQTGQSTFADVAADQWYTPGITWAAECGIVEGRDATQYAPLEPVTREQLAAMLYRYAQYKKWDTAARDGLTAFTDAGEVSAWAREAVEWAVGAGLMQGNGGKLTPQSGATRAQFAQMLMKLMEKYS